jgi:hypothetical protein
MFCSISTQADIALGKCSCRNENRGEALDCFNGALLKIGTRADRPDKAWVPLCAAAFDARPTVHAAILCAEATPDADFISERIPTTIETTGRFRYHRTNLRIASPLQAQRTHDERKRTVTKNIDSSPYCFVVIFGVVKA